MTFQCKLGLRMQLNSVLSSLSTKQTKWGVINRPLIILGNVDDPGLKTEPWEKNACRSLDSMVLVKPSAFNLFKITNKQIFLLECS